MNALINAHTLRDRSRSPYAGLTSSVLPEVQRSHTGVSSDYVQKANYEWFVLRVTYNRRQKANLLAAKNNYEEAFYLLSMIPSQCSKFDASISAGLSLWEKYKNYSCNTNLAKPEAIWISGQDYNAAIEAGKYLSQILPDSECYGKAIQLYNEIKKKVEDLWKFEMKQYDTESELKKAKILAFQAIGVAYGGGQQPKVTVKNSMF